MPKNLLHTLVAFLTHPLLQLVWLCIALTVPWLALSIDPYLWATTSLIAMYIAIPLFLLAAIELFRVREDPPQRHKVFKSLLYSIGATGHLALHLLWILQTNWRF